MNQTSSSIIPNAAPTRHGRRPGALARRLALLAVSFGAVPLVITQPAPLEDWPSHLARVGIVASLLDGDPFWAQFYHLNSFLLPNVALDVALVGLHAIGLSIATAGTLFLLATYALFILGGARLARAFGATDPVKPLIMAMLFYNGALMGGFANYMLGLGLAFCVLAAWIEQHDRPVRRLAIALLGTLAVFFTHLIAAGFLIAAMGLFELHGLIRLRQFTPAALVRHASPAVAAAMVIGLFAVSPTTADGPGGGGPILYTGQPSVAGVIKGKLILLAHPLLDGSGITGAVILISGMGLFLLLAFGVGRPILSAAARFVTLGLILLVIACPNGIGDGYGLDYRLVIPLACIAISATRLTWRSRRAHQVAVAVLLVTATARSASLIADFVEDKATYRAWEAAIAQIPPDSVLLTGMGSGWPEIPWTRFWAPPAEYLATEAAAAHVFVPTVFAIPSQHPLVLNQRFRPWRSFAFFGSSSDAALSRTRLAAACADWQALGHRGQTLMLLVYPSTASARFIPRRFVLQAGPGFELIDPCHLGP